ncbi:MAG TPA: OmpA family protein [Burkholderiaceae bacterium]|jgi:outer membrane protein OmpA-like peptidoglycan-associated protein
MSDQNDDSQNYALMVLAGVVGLVIAGVIALAVSTTMGDDAKTASAATAATAATAAAAPGSATAASGAGAAATEPNGRIYFELASDALPPEAAGMIALVADAARADATRSVQISGYHDASGDAAKNAELAKNRALAVRDALVAAGVPLERIQMDKPIETTGGADAREARRVELRLH